MATRCAILPDVVPVRREGGRSEVVLRSGNLLGEGPAWDERTGSLLWVDIDAGEVHRLTGGGAHTVLVFGAPISAVIPTERDGEYVLLRRSEVVRVTPSGEESLVALELPESSMLFNDAKCDPHGNLWAGTKNWAGRPTAALYRIVPTLDREVKRTGITISNGLGWSPSGTTMYHVDTPTRRIDMFNVDLAAGTLGDRRTLAEIEEGAGLPDGLCVDAEGGVWVALWNGRAVRRYHATGELDRVVVIPTLCPTSCTLGGSDFRTLFVTSSRDGARAAGHDDELAGAVFSVEAEVPGLPVARFRG